MKDTIKKFVLLSCSVFVVLSTVSHSLAYFTDTAFSHSSYQVKSLEGEEAAINEKQETEPSEETSESEPTETEPTETESTETESTESETTVLEESGDEK